MYYLSKAYRSVILVAGLFLMSCGTTNPTPDLHGTITVLDGSCQPSDPSNFAVRLEGTDRHAITDANGNWSLGSAAPGSYALIFSKDGFDSTRIIGGFYPNASDGENASINNEIVHRSNLSVVLNAPTFLDTSFDGKPFYIATIEGNAVYPLGIEARDVEVFFYLSPDKNMDPINNPKLLHFSSATSGHYYSDPQKFYTQWNLYDLENTTWGWPKGTTIYVVAYVGRLCESSGLEYESSIRAAISPNHSEVQSFVLP